MNTPTSKLLALTLEHLHWLVAHDSQNPPRRPDGLVEQLMVVLRGADLEVSLEDHGAGCISILAARGQGGRSAKALLTAHLDTVPVAPGWTRDPLALTLEGDRAYGLGACDVKGGAAAMIAAALATDAPCTLLFTTDEEAGKATCMRRFVESAPRFDFAVVAEPTHARAVVAHRGVGTGVLSFEGRAGHSSQRTQGSGAEPKSAVHALGAWVARGMALAADLETEEASGLSGVRFNVGRVEGGEKPNVVAARAEARFGVRPPPHISPRDALVRFASLDPEARFELAFEGPPLAASETAERACARYDLPRGEAVDFWTEAALLAQGGIPSIVLGPGDIAQAHGPDEWVLLRELEEAAQRYLRILEGGAS